MNNITEMMMETYVSESTALRVEKLENLKGKNAITIYIQILDVNVYDTASKVRKSAIDAINSFATGEDTQRLFKSIDLLTQVNGVNIKEARRKIADKLIEDNCYKF